MIRCLHDLLTLLWRAVGAGGRACVENSAVDMSFAGGASRISLASRDVSVLSRQTCCFCGATGSAAIETGCPFLDL